MTADPLLADLEAFREVSWAGFVRFAVAEVGMQKAYEAETGKTFTPGELEPYITWATVEHWGWDEAPARWKAPHPKPEGGA